MHAVHGECSARTVPQLSEMEKICSGAGRQAGDPPVLCVQGAAALDHRWFRRRCCSAAATAWALAATWSYLTSSRLYVRSPVPAARLTAGQARRGGMRASPRLGCPLVSFAVRPGSSVFD